MLSVITEPFTHSTPGEGCKILQRRSLGRSSGDDDRILHRIILLQSLHKLCNSRPLLPNSNVHTVQFLVLVLSIIPPLLVKNRINSDGSLASLTISDDKLTLATTDGDHSVDGL